MTDAVMVTDAGLSEFRSATALAVLKATAEAVALQFFKHRIYNPVTYDADRGLQPRSKRLVLY